MKTFANNGHYVLEVPSANKADVANLMAYRGLTFSLSASSREKAVLFSPNPYALADLGDAPELAAYRREIDFSRALDGVGTRKLPPGLELWDYQKATLDYLIARGGGINGDQPGLGKTMTSIAYCNEIEAHRVLVITPASVRIQWGERIREWSTIPNCKISVMLKVKDGIHPNANYQVISYDAARNPAIMRAISKYKWDVLICDECLVGDTLIHTEIGDLTIREIVEKRLNIRIWSSDEKGNLRLNRIKRWVKAESLDLMDVATIHAHIRCTQGHRIYDEAFNAREAGKIRQGDAVQILRSRIFEHPVDPQKPILHQGMREQISVDRARQNGSCSASRDRADAVRGISNAQQCENATPQFRPYISRQTGRNIQVAKRDAFSCRSRRQWQAYAGASINLARIARLVARMGAGICNIHQTNIERIFWLAYALQSRFSKSKIEDSNRGRRHRAQISPGQGTRSTQRLDFGQIRVDSVLVYKCRDNQPIAVYDLEIERDHNYIANGILVSNCHKMKNVDALTSRAILGNSRGEYQHGETKVPAIASYCTHKLALTGTLLQNRPSECFNLFRHFDHEAIDFLSEEDFKNRYNKQADMKTIEGKRFKLESTSLELELQNRLRVNILARHEKKDVLSFMKPPRYSVVRCTENGAVKGALDVEGMLGLSIDEIQTTKDFTILGHIAEARRLMGMALAPQIIDYATDFLDGSDEKLVIFGWHIDVLNLFEAGLSHYGTVVVNGKKSPQARQNALDDFVNRPNVRVFIGNIQAAGTGLDGLQKVCSRCYLAEPDWVPAQNEQAVSRLDRIGQEAIVSAEIFVAPGSISEKILVKALEKMNVIFRVLDQKE